MSKTIKRKDTTSSQSTGIRKGRFQTAMDQVFASFNASIRFDKRLYAEDIRGSIAHAKMLGRQGIITRDESKKIEKGLKEILTDIEHGKLQLREDLEDIHINIEEALKAKIGDVAGKLHTARSRNDQVALDLRMYLRAQTDLIRDELVEFMNVIVDTAEKNLDLIVPGYTHLQRAQPVRLAHHLMAYFQMFWRDFERFGDCRERTNQMPLGSAALAGTTFPIDREFVAKELGFQKVSPNSMDAVSDRDFVAEFIFNCAMVMMHLSRLSEEIILWSSTEFGFCSLPDTFCSGSSIMPQKKNPDACELIRGKVGRVYGDLIALLTTLKALPLTYNKDLQEDKEPAFDALDTVRGSLKILIRMFPGIHFHADKMLQAASDPMLAATDLADAMAKKGIPFREAHASIGSMISNASAAKTVVGIPTPEEIVEARNHIGGTSMNQVLAQIEAAKSLLQNYNRKVGNRKTRERKG